MGILEHQDATKPSNVIPSKTILTFDIIKCQVKSISSKVALMYE